jgi:hypothetical protein
MEYKVINGSSVSDLTEVIKGYINDGWTPIGPHQVVIKHQQNRYRGTQHMDTINQLEYSQTLIKEKIINERLDSSEIIS